MAKRHGLKIEVVDGGRDSRLNDVTAALLFRATRELLMNVVKHAGATSARITSRRDGECFEIEVEDHGVGFDPNDLGHRASGVGFGLFSVREQIQGLGGTVDVVSAPSVGTRITLRVPLEPAAAGGGRRGARPGMKILLADDHQMMRDGLRAILDKAGVQVAGEAANGHEALALARRLRPEVVIMDISMPALNGIDATARLVAETSRHQGHRPVHER